MGRLKEDEGGQGLLAYVLVVAAIAILLVAAWRGGILPRTGLTAPLAHLASAVDGIVSGLSGIARQGIRPFRFRFP